MESNGEECTGMGWNGVEWSGMESNGEECSGMEGNGIVWSGVERSLVEWN